MRGLWRPDGADGLQPAPSAGNQLPGGSPGIAFMIRCWLPRAAVSMTWSPGWRRLAPGMEPGYLVSVPARQTRVTSPAPHLGPADGASAGDRDESCPGWRAVRPCHGDDLGAECVAEGVGDLAGVNDLPGDVWASLNGVGGTDAPGLGRRLWAGRGQRRDGDHSPTVLARALPLLLGVDPR